MLVSLLPVASSCQKLPVGDVLDDVTDRSEENEIRFDVSVEGSPITKKVSVGDGYTCTTADMKSFRLKSVYDNNWLIKSGVYYFLNYSLDTSTNKFTASDRFYWPDGVSSSKPVIFYAMTVNNKAVSPSGTSAGMYKMTITDYTVTTEGGTAASIPASSGVSATGIYAKAIDQTIYQDDICVAITKATTKSDVNLTFKHILSRLQVRAKANIDPSYNLSVKILAYEFRNVGVKGTFTSEPDNLISWSSISYGSVRDNAHNEKYGTYLTSSEFKTFKNSWCNVIPSSISDSFGVVVKVAFYDTSKNGGDSKNDVYLGLRYLTVPKSGLDILNVSAFEAGKQYQFDFTVKDGGGKDTDGEGPDKELDLMELQVNSVTVTPWSDPIDQPIEFPDE